MSEIIFGLHATLVTAAASYLCGIIYEEITNGTTNS
jgi:hypothetical protein